MSRLAQAYSEAQRGLLDVITDLRDAGADSKEEVRHIIENIDGEINLLQELIDKEAKK